MSGVQRFSFSNAGGILFGGASGSDSSGIIGSEITDDWSTIREHSDNGTASSRYKVGSYKKLVLDGPVGGYTFIQYPCYCIIMGFDHNSNIEGTKRIHFCIGYSCGWPINRFIALCYNYENYYSNSAGGFVMNTTNTSAGGWADSYMRNTICVDFISCLPTELQAVLKTVTKYTCNASDGYSDNYVTATTDTIFLLSEYESGTSSRFGPSTERSYQQPYDLFTSSAKKVYNSLTGEVDSNGTSVHFRTYQSTIDRYAGQGFCRSLMYIGTGGSYTYGNLSLGFVPCFCV